MVSNRPGPPEQSAARRARPGPGDADVVGMRVTADGHIRQELLPDGRYDEARDSLRSACTGRCAVTGDHLDHVDDTGFTATGDIHDGVLFHGHLVP